LRQSARRRLIFRQVDQEYATGAGNIKRAWSMGCAGGVGMSFGYNKGGDIVQISGIGFDVGGAG